jgi:hypothetical protein
MNVIDMVQKPNPDIGRSVLLEEFVRAHFDESSGEHRTTNAEFQTVCQLLGRKDLDFGDVPNRLGKLTPDEVKWVNSTYREMERKVPKLKSRRHQQPNGGPYLSRLSPTEVLILNAFWSDGTVVRNPAVATALVEASLKNWFKVPTLLIPLNEILIQCVEQGDMHAAYLLGTAHWPKGDKFSRPTYLTEDSEKRKYYLESAKTHGHQGAIHWFEQEAMEAGLAEELSEENDADHLRWTNHDIDYALEYGPSAEGERLFEYGLQLVEANQSQFLFVHQEPENGKIFRQRHDLAIGWIEKAAVSNTKARHYLALKKGDLLFEKTYDESINPIDAEVEFSKVFNLLLASACPEAGVSPYLPAYVDLAEMCRSQRISPKHPEIQQSFKSDVARDYLVKAISGIQEPDCELALRIAPLCEWLYPGERAKAARFYSIAGKKSSYAAYRAGLIYLRESNKPNDIHAIKSLFELASQSNSWCPDERDTKARQFAGVALRIGWGTWQDPASWEDATGDLLQQLDDHSYQDSSLTPWITPGDIELLIGINPEYIRYTQWRLGWERYESTYGKSLSESDLNLTGKEHAIGSLRAVHFLYGSSDPLAFLKKLCVWNSHESYHHSVAEDESDIDFSCLAACFLQGQAYLIRSTNNDLDAIAERKFKTALTLIASLQEEAGGQGVNPRADLLRWMKSRTHIGIKNSQPTCRKISITEELNGPLNEFGDKFISILLNRLEGCKIPGLSKAKKIYYRDRYINTPFKVALFAQWMKALAECLKRENRWADCSLEVTTLNTLGKKSEIEEDIKRYGFGSFNSRASFVDGAERNEILVEALNRLGINSKVPNGLTNTETNHDRDLTIVFDDGCELQVDLGSGVGHWRAAKGGKTGINSYQPNRSPKVKADFLVAAQLHVASMVGGTNGCVIEWREAKSMY